MYIRVRLLTDGDIENPTTFDSAWKVASFNRCHVSFASREDFIGIGWRRKLDVGTAFLLYYQEHGSCRWSVWSVWSGDYDDLFKADGIAWFERPKEMGAKDYTGRERDCQTFLATYTDWCNGHGLGFEVSTVDGDLNEDGAPIGQGCELDTESCFGFYASDRGYFCEDVAGYILRYREMYGPDVGYVLPLVFTGDAAHYLQSYVEKTVSEAACIS